MEVQRNPRLAHRPLIVGDAEQPKRVLDCSSEALEAGVRPGMPIRKALAESPDAVVLPPDPVLYRNLWEEVLEALGEVTPELEDQSWGQAYLNVNGLAPHYRDEESLCEHIRSAVLSASSLESGIGLAEGKFPARVAGYESEPGTTCIVNRGEEARFLAPRSVTVLPVDPEVIYRLCLFGLERVGEVARLTHVDLQSQFGFAARRIWQLVNGIDDEPLRPRPYTETLSGRFSFDAPVAGIDVMIAVTRQLLSRLQPALKGRAARELIVQAELSSHRGWERRLVFREAVSEDERLFFVLRSSLQNSPPPQAVRSFCVRLSGLTGETGKQMSLGEHGRLQRQIEETIQQLKARYGYSPVYRCVDVEPWSPIPEERQILVESDV